MKFGSFTSVIFLPKKDTAIHKIYTKALLTKYYRVVYSLYLRVYQTTSDHEDQNPSLRSASLALYDSVSPREKDIHQSALYLYYLQVTAPKCNHQVTFPMLQKAYG